MSRQVTARALILKRQPLGETDELVTFFGETIGKLRALAKSVRLMKSKLRHGLQDLFLVDLTVSTGRMPKVLGVEVKHTHRNLRESPERSRLALYAVELILKGTPDEMPIPGLFALVERLFAFLDGPKATPPGVLEAALAKFRLEFLEIFGVGLEPLPGQVPDHFEPGLGFSHEPKIGSRTVSRAAYETFLALRERELGDLPGAQTLAGLSELQELLSSSVLFELEREVKSERFLSGRWYND